MDILPSHCSSSRLYTEDASAAALSVSERIGSGSTQNQTAVTTTGVEHRYQSAIDRPLAQIEVNCPLEHRTPTGRTLPVELRSKFDRTELADIDYRAWKTSCLV